MKKFLRLPRGRDLHQTIVSRPPFCTVPVACLAVLREHQLSVLISDYSDISLQLRPSDVQNRCGPRLRFEVYHANFVRVFFIITGLY